jgi:predicted TIM-barrel fold metal-dependent hydrolase
MKTKVGANKVIFGSNGLSWKRYLEQIDELGLREEAKKAILYDNPKKVYKL